VPRKKSKEPTAQGGRDTALRLLSRREHAAAELKYKLVRRGHDEATAADIVGQLAGAGWQSDTRYAEMLVRNRIEQGYGPLRIRAELEAAGVPDAEVRAALDATRPSGRNSIGSSPSAASSRSRCGRYSRGRRRMSFRAMPGCFFQS
jgi:SOS response regulatory protein OraA/RecX